MEDRIGHPSVSFEVGPEALHAGIDIHPSIFVERLQHLLPKEHFCLILIHFLQQGDLMRNRNVGKVRIDDLYNLIVVVGEFLKLEVKIVQLGDELHFRRVASDDYELFGDNAFDYKMAAVILRSGLAERAVVWLQQKSAPENL